MPSEIEVVDIDAPSPGIVTVSGVQYLSPVVASGAQTTLHWTVRNLGNTNLVITTATFQNPIGVILSVGPNLGGGLPATILPGGSASLAVDVFFTLTTWSFQISMSNNDSDENPFIVFPGSTAMGPGGGGSGTGGGGAGGGGGSSGGGSSGGGGTNPPPPAPTGGGGSGIAGTITSPQSLSLAFTPIPEYTKTDAMPLEVNRRLDEAYRVIRNMSARLAQLED